MNKLEIKTKKLQTGFLKLNSKNLVSPIDPSEPIAESNCIGVWMTNIPNIDEDSKFKCNPYVWSV